jgi:hypothetical protein
MLKWSKFDLVLVWSGTILDYCTDTRCIGPKRYCYFVINKQTNSVTRVRERTIPTERQPLTFAVRWRHVVSVTDPYGLILGFLDRSRYVFSSIVLPRLSEPRSRRITSQKI